MKLIPDSIDLADYLRPPDPGEKVLPAGSLFEQVRDHYLAPRETRGALLPWDATGPMVRLRKGEVSLWPGTNGHGKSLVTSQVALSLAMQGERVCMASFEMKPVSTMVRMTRQAGGSDPKLAFIRDFHRWTDDKLWIFDHMGQIDWARVVAVVRYCSDRLGVTHFFVDSLMKCVRGEDDYNGQKDFLNALCSVALDTGVHVHLVHHTKKLTDENQQPGKFDAKGSGSITDQVDNVFSVWRNKHKERKIEDGSADEDDRKAPDTVIICDKQRHGEWEGRIGLWFSRERTTYASNSKWTWDHGNDFAPQRQPGEDEA